eukprot:SAG11_NODE_1027_length_6131_cov_22.835710_4_plen_119_part_00
MKQYLLSNGVAVVEANAYQFDGWEAWREEWDGGYDSIFFTELVKAMRSGTANRQGAASTAGGDDGHLGMLDPARVALRGYSGSAQMVSFLINLQARAQLLKELKIKAGVFMAGGSHAW